MRPFIVEFLHEGIEFGLLLKTVHARWPRGLFLQGQMHALVTAFLLGMAWPHALDANPQTQPHTESLDKL